MNNKEAIKLISKLMSEMKSKPMNSAEIFLYEALEKSINLLQKEDDVKSISIIDNLSCIINIPLTPNNYQLPEDFDYLLQDPEFINKINNNYFTQFIKADNCSGNFIDEEFITYKTDSPDNIRIINISLFGGNIVIRFVPSNANILHDIVTGKYKICIGFYSYMKNNLRHIAKLSEIYIKEKAEATIVSNRDDLEKITPTYIENSSRNPLNFYREIIENIDK